MDSFLKMLFVGLVLLSLIPSLLHDNVLKRDSYLTSCFNVALMMLGFYWEHKGLLFLVISILVYLCLFFCIYYYRIYKNSDFKREDFTNPKNKAITYLSILLFVVPMAVESNYTMLCLLVIYIILDRIVFFRRFKTVF